MKLAFKCRSCMTIQPPLEQHEPAYQNYQTDMTTCGCGRALPLAMQSKKKWWGSAAGQYVFGGALPLAWRKMAGLNVV